MAFIGVVPLALLMLTLRHARFTVRDRTEPDRPAIERGMAQISRPVIAAFAAALATPATAGVKVFLTETAVTGGMSAGAVGVMLAVAGLAGVIARIEMGRRVDRRTGKAVEMTSALMLVGSVAMVAGAIGWPPLLVPAAVGVFAGGAGWSGLLLFALVESRPEAGVPLQAWASRA
jgi:predicted MFS family arabinose efflux permease